MLPPGGHQSGWDGHVLLAYATESERRAGVVAWVRRGLDAGAKMVYVETAQERAERSLVRVLRDDDVDVADPLRRGQLQLVDPSVGIGAAWQAALVDEALDAGYRTVRLGGEATTSWGVMSLPSHTDAEGAADELCRTRPMSVLCQYPADLGPSMLQRACTLHSAGLRGSKLHTRPVPDGIELGGEVDVSNVQIVQAAVAAACDTVGPEPHPDPTVVLDVARLDFLDVAGARALVLATAAHRARGVVVLVRAARPPVLLLLRQLGVEQFGGIVIEGGS